MARLKERASRADGGAVRRPARRPVRAMAAALLLALGAGASAGDAAAEPGFTFVGRGFGHGVGMSQYGARGAALAGWDAPRILAHYYPGTTLAPAPRSSLRVRIVQGAPSVPLGGDAELRAAWTGGPGSGLSLPAGATVAAVAEADGSVVLHDAAGAELGRGPGPLVLTPSRPGTLRVAGRRYRGTLRLDAAAGRLDVVNTVALEEYLAGVLPREVPASWGDATPAALDAQAIAARSYALASARSGGAFDLHADTRSQVYGGRDGEDPRTTAAVTRTRGQVLTFLGRVIPAYFFSSSGGRTEGVQHVWGSAPVPYLVSVPDPFDAGSPYHRWPDRPAFGATDLGARLGLGQPVARVVVLARGDSPRVRRVRLIGAAGARRELTGAEVRTALGLRGTWFRIVRR